VESSIIIDPVVIWLLRMQIVCTTYFLSLGTKTMRTINSGLNVDGLS
jgi:hypothetical protein